MYKCPNKNLPEWKELEKVVPEVAYTIWDMNNGNGIDKAPNGEPSILFLSILDIVGDRDTAIIAKSKAYSSLFKYGAIDANSEATILLYLLYYSIPLSKSIKKSDEIRQFDNTKDLIEYVLKLNGVSSRVKNILKLLQQESTELIIQDTSLSKTARASYAGHVRLYANVIDRSTNLDIAEDVAHEMLHHYLQLYYDINPSFRKKIDTLRKTYQQTLPLSDEYGLDSKVDSIEFLNEFLANDRFRNLIKATTPGLFSNILNYIRTIFSKFFKNVSIKTPSVLELTQLEETAMEIIGKVNAAEISHYTESTYDDGVMLFKESTTQLSELDKLYESIIKGVKSRLDSVKRYTTKNPKVWSQLLTLLLQLSNKEAELGMIQFIDHINDTISSSIKFLLKPIDTINAKQIRQLSNDYIGFYKPLVDQIRYLMDTTDLFKDLSDYNDLKAHILMVSRSLDEVNNKFMNVLKSKGQKHLRQYLLEQGMPLEDILNTIEWLNDPKHDSNLFMNWFGMATNSNNAVQQAIAKMLNDTKNATDRQTLEVGIQLAKLVNAAKDKYGNDVLKLMYEKLDDGTYSGYRVKPLNWGQLRKNLKDFMQSLAEKLGIEKDDKNQYALPQDEGILKKWFDAINEWYGKNVDRKYTPEYYSLRNKMLSMKTRDAINEILNYINNIIDSITVNGVQLDNLLSESEYAQLLSLRKQKKLLANRYNLDGSEKTGDDAIIAKELTNFNEKVSGNIEYLADLAKYKSDRLKVVTKYGEGSKELKLWESRNTAERYNQAFWDRIDSLERAPQSKEYELLKSRRRELHNLFKNPSTNEIDVDGLSDQERALLLKLDLDLADIYTMLGTDNSNAGDRFSNFAEIVYTAQYYKDSEAAKQAGTEAYTLWYNANHYEDIKGYMKPAHYYTKIKPLLEFELLYTELVPTGRYVKLDPTSNWFNKNWDETGPAILPNKKLYDNSKAYADMSDKPEVKELYDAIEGTMQQANKWISFLLSSNDNRMPQIPARFMQVLNRKDGTMAKLGYALEDFAITKDDDLDFVKEFATMPNGDPIKVIPTRFIKMLEDPNIISTDAVSAVVLYYNMAANYNNMSEQLDDVEVMLNLLKSLTIKTSKETKTPGSTNVYKQSQLLVDRLMYGKNKTPLVYEAFGKEINMGKALDTVRNFVTKVNLSGNIWSIGTSLFTDITYTTIEAKLGRFFLLEDLAFAQKEFSRNMPDMMANIGNPAPKGKLPYLLMLNQVVKDNKELFDRLDLSSALRSINLNFWYAGYTLSDYTVKSHTLLSIYHNHRFVEGEGFMSKTLYVDKYYSNDRNKGAIVFKLLKTTLYDAYITDKSGEVSIDSKYDKYITPKLLNNIRNRIDILSKRIDGTLREVDKAGVHANSIASYIVMHRNFMVSALQDRFKNRLYNLDLGVTEEGYYRGTGRFLKNVIGSKHFALKQMLADYNNLQDYEQYAVRRVLNELLLIAGSTSVAIAMASLVDGDDDYDTWITLSITYLAMRSAFEFRTMYNPFELISLIKSPTAAFNWLDNASSFVSLVNPASYFGDKTPFSSVKSGVYKGMPLILKNVIKTTPFKSGFEAQDPKTKRNYLLNQLMSF